MAEVEVKLNGAGKLNVRFTEGKAASSTQFGIPLRDPSEVDESAATCKANWEVSLEMGVW